MKLITRKLPFACTILIYVAQGLVSPLTSNAAPTNNANEQLALRSALANTSTNSAAGPKIGPGDKLVYVVAEDPHVGASPRQAMVDAKYNVHFPVSDGFPEDVVINAKDKTVSQIQQELKQKLDALYYKNATVTVESGSQALAAGKIVITGPVRNNFIPLRPGERKMMLETILECGATEFANLKKVKVLRINPNHPDKYDEFIVNVEAIEKDPTKDVPVFDGDRIIIIEKNILFQ